MADFSKDFHDQYILLVECHHCGCQDRRSFTRSMESESSFFMSPFDKKKMKNKTKLHIITNIHAYRPKTEPLFFR